jgi:hypothetical protein
MPPTDERKQRGRAHVRDQLLEHEQHQDCHKRRGGKGE